MARKDKELDKDLEKATDKKEDVGVKTDINNVSEDLEDKIPMVKCVFLINVKYNKEIKKMGDSMELPIDEAEFLEENEILKIVE